MLTRRKSSLLWVAVAALTLVAVARAQSGIASGFTSARAYASPIMHVLAAYQSEAQSASAHDRSHSSGVVQNSIGQPLIAGLLPVLFVGLQISLTARCETSAQSLGRAPSAPARPFLFQRPPPQIL